MPLLTVRKKDVKHQQSSLKISPYLLEFPDGEMTSITTPTHPAAPADEKEPTPPATRTRGLKPATAAKTADVGY